MVVVAVEGEELRQVQGEEGAGHLRPSGGRAQVAEGQVLPLGAEPEQEETADQSNSLYSETGCWPDLASSPPREKDG